MSLTAGDSLFVEEELKIVMIGEPSTGKSCIVSRYCHDDFTRQYIPTCGVEFYLKRTQIQGRNVRINIWDTSGLSSGLFPKYIYNANAIIITYDITDSASFSAVSSWYNKVISGQYTNVPKFALFANKCDLEHKRTVTEEKQILFSKEFRILISQSISARTGENITFAWQQLVAECLGLKLSKFDLEQHLVRPVQAEIETTINQYKTILSNQQQITSSTICDIQ
ncbi:Small GTP-binding protein domain,P-loop containing nucleoside triphosphate hydrolase,Small GTPase [Cinara cedri]|uniref:Small GTP-binding protein domain,P-loop containing nucleoside triphosphate hydrolase,Small GTPase n=1 Tax=Cinara cedri TaxID=506608 RepID=A0A5E4M343_9HEMI|nr:Small GTP-binding protein domain,P-loop containing nucleoside triphosphate hydrolase,Small GTPase [Cinara cedri]